MWDSQYCGHAKYHSNKAACVFYDPSGRAGMLLDAAPKEINGWIVIAARGVHSKIRSATLKPRMQQLFWVHAFETGVAKTCWKLMGRVWSYTGHMPSLSSVTVTFIKVWDRMRLLRENLPEQSGLLLQHTTHTNGRQEVSARSARTGVRSRSSEEPQQPHVGNYRLLKTIGKGNFAKVKLARHILTGREVSPATLLFVVLLNNN